MHYPTRLPSSSGPMGMLTYRVITSATFAYPSASNAVVW